MDSMNGTDEREGTGCIAWTMATLALAIALAMFCCGCEDDTDNTTINEADINVGSNGVLLIEGNNGTVSVDQTTSDGNDDSIIISGNTGRVYVITRPYIPEIPEPEPVQ
jgi:hypothetical protein